jgi:hypothetical protein
MRPKKTESFIARSTIRRLILGFYMLQDPTTASKVPNLRRESG